MSSKKIDIYKDLSQEERIELFTNVYFEAGLACCFDAVENHLGVLDIERRSALFNALGKLYDNYYTEEKILDAIIENLEKIACTKLLVPVC